MIVEIVQAMPGMTTCYYLALKEPVLLQILSVAILLYTPLVCNQPIAVPILAAYGGVLTRCTISLIGFYRLVFPKLSKTTVVR